MMDQANQNNSELKQAIIGTAAFFDMFDHPLTDWEIWKFGQYKERVSYIEIKKYLENNSSSFLEYQGGFYFLSGRAENVAERKKRYYFADIKYKRAVWISKIFALLPWIKMIAIGNFVGSHNSRENSDIDFFIIAQAGRLWLSRFFCAAITSVLGLRPKNGKNKNKICLSFFVSADNLDLSQYMLKNNFGEIDDIYFLYWLANLTPILIRDNLYEKLVFTNKKVLSVLPNWQPMSQNHYRTVEKKSWGIMEFKFSWLEKILMNWQIKKFPSNIKELLNKDTKVVANEEVIKLHVNDRREEYNKFLISKL